jgi:hypothetical protein
MSRFRKTVAKTFGFDKERLPFYRDLSLATLGGFALIFALIFLDEWHRNRDSFDLEAGFGALGLALTCVILSPNRRLLMSLELGAVVTLGTVGSILTRRIEAIPFILISLLGMLILGLIPTLKRKPPPEQIDKRE